MENAYTVFLTKNEFREIVANYEMMGDESYSFHTANLIYAKLKEDYPEEFEDINL